MRNVAVRYKPNLHCFPSLEELKLAYPESTQDEIDEVVIPQGDAHVEISTENLEALANMAKAEMDRKMAALRDTQQ